MKNRTKILLLIVLGLVLRCGGLQAQSGVSDELVQRYLEQLLLNGGRTDLTQTSVKQLNRIINLCSERYGTESSEMADCLLWASRQVAEKDDLVQAEQLLRLSSQLFRRHGSGPFHGRDTLQQIYYCDLKALIEGRLERELTMLNYQKRSYRLKQRTFGTKSEVTLNAMLDLSETYAQRLEFGKSNKLHNEAFGSYVDMLKREFASRSESERQMYWEKAERYVQRTIDIADNYAARHSHGQSADLSKAAYNAILLSKGILLNTTVAFDNYVRSSGVESANRLLNQKKQALNSGAPTARIDSFDYAIMRQLREHCREYEASQMNLTWEDVAAALSDDDLAIEFYHTSSGGYGALLLRKGWSSPITVHLDELIKTKPVVKTNEKGKKITLHSLPLDEALSDNHLYSFEGDKYHTLWNLSRQIWCNEVLRHFPTTDKGRVFFAADGELLVTAIEYLPWLQETEGEPLVISDLYDMYRLSSTRELALSERSVGTHASVYGGLSYNMSKQQISADMTHYPEVAKRQNTERSVIGALNRDFAEIIKPLQGTQKEAQNICNTLNSSLNDSLSATLLTDTLGTEASFKDLDGKHTRIIHIATHGFYLPRPDSVSTTQYDPLKNTGLIMAGAQRALLGYEIPKGAEDGILTSKEICALNLVGTDLVVLSACETGKGAVAPDGVFGLQRGFKMASANTILMSLWKVNDEVTQQLMTGIYQAYIQTNDLHKAFAQARRKIKKQHPQYYYWAAFILLDATR